MLLQLFNWWLLKPYQTTFQDWDKTKNFAKKIITSRKSSYFYKVCYGTSNLKTLVGTSTQAMSTMLVNCALWWSFRKAITGRTPSGWIRISNSSPDIRRTFWTYLGRHWPTYWPKSSSCFFRSGDTEGLAIAGKQKLSEITCILKEIYLNIYPKGWQPYIYREYQINKLLPQLFWDLTIIFRFNNKQNVSTFFNTKNDI